MNSRSESRGRILFRLLALAVLCFSLAPTVRAQPPDDDPVPYLYYYSDVLNGIVIERADGTDSRLIGQGITLCSQRLAGPGWSPDGKWFAWNTLQIGPWSNSYCSAHVLEVSTDRILEVVQQIIVITSIDWSPDGQYSLVLGERTQSNYEETIWLIDLETDTVLAAFDYVSAPASSPPRYYQADWIIDDEQVVTYGIEGIGDDFRPFRVALHFDGTVIKTYAAPNEPLGPLVPLEAIHVPADNHDVKCDRFPIDSPEGRYIGCSMGLLKDSSSGEFVELPRHSDATSRVVLDVKWHPSEEWAILGYDRCITDCTAIGGTSVMNLDGRVVRELASCGFEDACIGWLPDTVNLDALPPGQPDSVLLAPLIFDFDVSDGFVVEQPYAKTCNEEETIIEDRETAEVRFTFPGSSGCSGTSSEREEDIFYPFALSPDSRLYAAPAEGKTGLYDATTGKLVALVDEIPIALAFNEDGTVLEVRSYQALTTWDVQEAIARYAGE